MRGDARDALLALVVGILMVAVWPGPAEPSSAAVQWVQVEGGPAPGVFAVPPGTTVGQVAELVGVSLDDGRLVQPETAVRLSAHGAIITRSDPLLEGRRIDPNRDGAQSLLRLAGVGPSRVGDVLAARPLYEPADLASVPGLGARAVETHAGMLDWDNAPTRPAAPPPNVNSAGAEVFRGVRGIGEVLSQRIIADRDRLGPFSSVGDVSRVLGVGPTTVRQLHEAGFEH